MILLVPFIAAILYRLRGSALIPWGDTTSRIFVWGIPMGIITYLMFGGPWWMYGVYSLAWFLGTVMGWDPWTELTSAKDWFCLTLRGICVTLLAGGTLCTVTIKGGIVLALFGAFTSVAYWIGQRIKSKIPNLETGRELGEVFTGFIPCGCGLLAAYFAQHFIQILITYP